MLESLLLGLVEGLTEFLPVSSTGHLLLVEALLGNHRSALFNVLIQIGPILAVTVAFRQDIVGLIRGWKDPASRDYIVKLSACVLGIGIGGLAVKKAGYELPETVTPVAWAVFLGGLVIFAAEAWVRKRTLSASIGWNVVAAVAFAQVLSAVFPGTSRSGAAVIAALLCGVSRPEGVRLAFLSGIPVMFAAGGLEFKEAAEEGGLAELYSVETWVAFAVATVTAWASVVWLMRFVQTRDFRPFGWYRLGLSLVLFAALWSGTLV